MRQKAKSLMALSRFVCVCFVVSGGIAIIGHPAQANSLDKPACEALKREHNTLLEHDLKDDIRRGHEWAKEHLGQLKLQQISRLFYIEEQLAFRCKGVALMTAIVIPSLRVVVPPKVKATNVNAGPGASARGALPKGIRQSAVPIPVKRPALAPTQKAGQTTVAPPPKVTAKAKVGAPSDTKAKLPKVIRLQKPKNTANDKARRAKARQAKARQIRARKARQRRRRPDTYVPPPVNPGYQPSLGSP